MDSYKRIRSNVWHTSATVARVVEEAERCSCHVQGNNCSTSECINRGLLVECSPQTCECGDKCANQRMQRGAKVRTKVVHIADSKGYGMVAAEALSASALVAEYIGAGEVISQAELARRLATEYATMRHTYIMTYIRGLFLDATVKGGLARFINHSCDPNCETQKWIVKGETRVGIFARRRIEAGEELTYDYQLEWNGFARVRCMCGSANCSGWLGGDGRERFGGTVLDSDDEVAEGLYEADEYGGFTKDMGAAESVSLKSNPIADQPHERLSSAEQLLDDRTAHSRGASTSESEDAADDMHATEQPRVDRESVEEALWACTAASRYPHARHANLAQAEMDCGVRDACERADMRFEEHVHVVADLMMAMQAVGKHTMPEAAEPPRGRLRSSTMQR